MNASLPDEDLAGPLPPLWEPAADTPTPDAWRDRSSALVGEFARTVYGVTPPGPHPVSVHRTSEERGVYDGRADRLRCEVVVACPSGELAVDLLVHTPAGSGPGRPAPLFVGLNFTGNDATLDGEQSDRWPYERVVAAGFAVLTADYRQFEPDHPGPSTTGVRTLFRQEGQPSPWGALGAWSWGLSRCLDAAELIPGPDAGRAIVLGHSRLGKAALWAAAQDVRFAAAISNDSGCGGASLFRHHRGEDVAAITRVFPHWFTPSFARFAHRERHLPVDQHQLLASIAPRPVHVASASDDLWADPLGEFLATVAAEPAFRLHGRSGPAPVRTLPSGRIVLPPAGPAVGGELSYHLRSGAHDMTAEDWDHFVAFARRAVARP